MAGNLKSLANLPVNSLTCLLIPPTRKRKHLLKKQMSQSLYIKTLAHLFLRYNMKIQFDK